MPIPARLARQPAVDELVREMSDLCDAIEDALERGDNASELLEQWHRHATRRCDPSEFRAYWKSTDQETFVRDALHPVAQLMPDLRYDEALEVLRSVVGVELSEADTMFYLRWLESQFPGSNMNDLVYWPDVWFGDASLFRDEGGAFKPEAQLSPEQMLAYAMARSGRELPNAPGDVELPFPFSPAP